MSVGNLGPKSNFETQGNENRPMQDNHQNKIPFKNVSF